MGGGTVLILLLSLILKMDQHIAQATNLVVFIPTAITATLVNSKNKNIKWKVTLPIAITGMVGSAIGANISSKMNVELLKKLFGVFLLIIAIYEIYSLYKMYRKEKNSHTKNRKSE